MTEKQAKDAFVEHGGADLVLPSNDSPSLDKPIVRLGNMLAIGIGLIFLVFAVVALGTAATLFIEWLS